MEENKNHSGSLTDDSGTPAKIRDRRDQLAALIGQGIRECGITVSRDEEEGDGRCLEVEGIPAVSSSCFLIVDGATVRWEYFPSSADEKDAKRTADIVTALLGDKDSPYKRLNDGHESKSLGFKGIVGHELLARGFSVDLKTYQDHFSFDAWADISVTSEKETGMRVLVDDSGGILLDASYLAGIREIANDIKVRIRRITGV